MWVSAGSSQSVLVWLNSLSTLMLTVGSLTQYWLGKPQPSLPCLLPTQLQMSCAKVLNGSGCMAAGVLQAELIR